MARRLSPVGPGSPPRIPAARRIVADHAPRAEHRWDGRLAGLAHRAIDGLWFRVALGTILALGAMSVNWALQVVPVDPVGAPNGSTVPAASVDIAVVPTIAPASPSSLRSHVVASGDTLIGLASRYYGDESRWREILQANQDRIGDPANLLIGTELLIPNP